jgi:hypothetical protein
MIDEELLVQRALELGLAHLDRRVRADLTSSVINAVVNDVDDNDPSERQLRDFYSENQSYFTRPGRIRVKQIFFRSRAADRVARDGGPLDGGARAERAHGELLAGRDWDSVKAKWGDMEIAPLPNTMLPAAKIREYLGPTVLRSILELSVGQTSPPVRSGTGFHIVQLSDRGHAQAPAFEEVAELVKVDWRRRRGDEALRSYLADLRAAANIEIAPGREPGSTGTGLE